MDKLGYMTKGKVIVAAARRAEKRKPEIGMRLAAAGTLAIFALSTAGAYALGRTHNGAPRSEQASSNKSHDSSSITVNNTSSGWSSTTDNAQLRIVAMFGDNPYRSTWGVKQPVAFSYGYTPDLYGGPVPSSSGVYKMAAVETKPDLNNSNDLGVEFTSKPIKADIIIKVGELATVVFDFANRTEQTIYTPEQTIPATPVSHPASW